MPLPRPGNLLAGCAALLAAALLAGCQPMPAGPTTAPNAPVTSSPPAASPSPTPLDLTLPHRARQMVGRLLAAAGEGELIMVAVTSETATISVLGPDGGEPATWAYRDGKIQQVDSDLQYVDQASFEIDDFDISDLGRLFRVAAALSGSTQQQTLQIVDYSGGRVVMTVTTNPESRTVFFNPDGTLLSELNYHTEKGVTDGLGVVLEGMVAVQRVGVDSATGAWVEYRGPESTTIHRQRPAKVPVTTVSRDEVLDLDGFAAGTVDPGAIWRVVERELAGEDLPEDVPWRVTIDDRSETGTPRMYFTVGADEFATDLAGSPIREP